MAEGKSSERPATRTATPEPPASGRAITLVNDTRSDVVAYLQNRIWASISLGYIRAGESLALPSVVNADAYVLYELRKSDVFLRWPGPEIRYTKKKINLTPGETYKISAFSE